MTRLLKSLLDSYLGCHIDEICPHKYVADNHCAHFVSHVLQLPFGYTCEGRPNPKKGGVNVRVHEIFAQCPEVGEIISCPPQQSDCLIFVTAIGNVDLKLRALEKSLGKPLSMRNVPKKHIGLLKDGMVWHYSNSKRQVVCQSATEFIFHYRKQTNGLWFGTLPVDADPIPWNLCLVTTEG